MTTTPGIDTSRPTKTILGISLPIFIAAGAAVSVSLVDAYFVAKLGLPALASIGYAFPVVFLGTSLAMGFSNGMRATIASAVGAGDRREIGYLASYGLLLTALIFVPIGLAAYAALGWLEGLLGVEAGLGTMFREYLEPMCLGLVLLGLNVGIGAVFTGLGRASIAGVLMILAAVLNAVLDPLLIFGYGPFPALGVAGAGWATMLSWGASTAVGLVLVLRERFAVGLDPAVARRACGRVLSIGLPYTFTAIIWPVALGLVTHWVAAHGPDAVAAWGVGARLATVARIGSVSLGAGVQVVVGVAFGAQRWPDACAATASSRWLNYAFGVLVCVVVIPASPWIAETMTESVESARVLRQYLWIATPGYGLLGSVIGAACVFSAIDRPAYTVVLYLAGGALFLLPMVWLGHVWVGLPGIFAGLTASALAADLLATMLLRHNGLTTPQRRPG
jgi:putative MATE family efflux protein